MSKPKFKDTSKAVRKAIAAIAGTATGRFSSDTPHESNVPKADESFEGLTRGKPIGSEMVHVDDWVDSNFGKHQYPRWFFFLHRLAAAYKIDWSQWISQYHLFCTYDGKRYRVTGASRMGDIWLATDFERTIGYDLRVDLARCIEWTNTPEVENDTSTRAKEELKKDAYVSIYTPNEV